MYSCDSLIKLYEDHLAQAKLLSELLFLDKLA